ncbi:unnamed protein product, partial [Brenthis ino]
MPLLNNLVTLIFAISCIRNGSAAAFSNVIVRRGPVEYLNYDPATFSFATPQLAQLSADPIESVVPIPPVPSVVTPCVSPCVIRNGPPTGLTPISATTNARIVALKSTLANVPEANGYQYAYAVFDENTGDKKTQSEQSDGSVVQGQYSFIQPDGFRREVIYTADDLKGFNAVVRNISPEPEIQQEENIKEKNETKKPIPPCHEVKSEQLTHAHEENSEDGIEHMEEKKNEESIDEKSPEKNVEKSDKSAKKSNESAEKSHEDSYLAVSSVENKPHTSNAIISYHDIINCLQTKLKGAQNAVSPLTYVLVPSSRSPC